MGPWRSWMRRWSRTRARRVVATGDPTAHAVMGAIRGAARRLGRPSLSGVTVFSMVEPCAMCVGALLQSDADGLVYALRDPVGGACGSSLQLAETPGRPRRLRVVSGILRDDAAELRPDLDVDRADARPAVVRWHGSPPSRDAHHGAGIPGRRRALLSSAAERCPSG